MPHHVDARTRALQAGVTAAVLKQAEDPTKDIADERRRATFDVNDLLYYLNGGKDKVARR
jgi:acyl-CoA oxidase